MKTERQSNIELARLVAVAGIIVLHYNNPTMGGGIAYVGNCVNLYCLYLLESVFVCGVDLFILISGYFLCTSNRRNLWKPAELILQVMFFSLVLYLVGALSNHGIISIKGIAGSLIPANYFVILYIAVYIISPFVNIILENLSGGQLRTFIIICILLFSVYPTFVDVLNELTGNQWNGLSTIGMYGSQWGYTIVNFLLMYIVGAYLRLSDLKMKKWKTKKILGVWAGCIILITVWAVINDHVGYMTERSAWEYCNPLVILCAILVFLLCTRIRLGVNRTINKISEGVFAVYLLHGIFLPHIGIQTAVTGNVLFMIGHILLSVLGICVLCLCSYVIYSWISKPIFRKLEDKIHLPVINLDTFERIER